MTLRHFKPRKYIVNRELLERWRNRDRLGIQAIADKYGCDKTTVRNWLVRWKMPTELEPVIGPQGLNGLDEFDTHETSERRSVLNELCQPEVN